MPAPRLRSRSKRRVSVRLPGNKSVVHYKPRLGLKPKCRNCGKPLHGIVTGRKGLKLSRSARRIARPFSDLCSECMRDLLIKRAIQHAQQS
ncbi:50S ribosomal protein L34e [Candidatus Woesearchaeota archaeon]|nr:50S ribosomal protein L34e [Candidatus Woesearchaeota archaeon]